MRHFKNSVFFIELGHFVYKSYISNKIKVVKGREGGGMGKEELYKIFFQLEEKLFLHSYQGKSPSNKIMWGNYEKKHVFICDLFGRVKFTKSIFQGHVVQKKIAMTSTFNIDINFFLP